MVHKGSTDTLPRTTLCAAYGKKEAPTGPGVYKVFCCGKLMKIGKAEDGLRK